MKIRIVDDAIADEVAHAVVVVRRIEKRDAIARIRRPVAVIC
jgi:hypothetical protein